MQPPVVTSKPQEVVRIAQELFRQSPDWVTFFREILGAEGAVRKLFRTKPELDAFHQSAEYQEIQHMLDQLRLSGAVQIDDREPTRVITVRLPQSLHESLRVEADLLNTSVNKLCITKLLKLVDGEVPR